MTSGQVLRETRKGRPWHRCVVHTPRKDPRWNGEVHRYNRKDISDHVYLDRRDLRVAGSLGWWTDHS